jgi:serpin B
MRRQGFEQLVMTSVIVALTLTACGGAAPVTPSPAPSTQQNATQTARPTAGQAVTSAPALTPAPTASPQAQATPTAVKGGNVARVSDEIIKNKLSMANTQFSLKLLQEILKQDAGKNVFISPASIAIALAMTYNGASGETQKAMAQALELNGMSIDEVNQAYASLKQSLENADPKVTLNIANSLWLREGASLKDDFLQRNRTYFGADVTERNFADPATVAVINGWVKEKTHGKIEAIIDQISPQMVLFLINAIYFKGSWTTEFDKAKTSDQPFTLLDNSQKSVPLMTQSGKFQYYSGGDFQMVSLPYGDGRLSMLVLLPAESSSLTQLEQKLTATNWQQWLGQLHEAEGTLKLPRFKLEYEKQLNQTLKALGMGVAFDPQAADFSALYSGPDNLFISDVRHKTFVEVNEEGTEAAAVTSVGAETTSMREQPEPFEMIVNRPFMVAIRDSATGTLLFMGAIVQP